MNPPDVSAQPGQGDNKSYLPFFKTTIWSEVLSAGTDDPASREALSHLCQNYYPALCTYLRYCKYPRDEAEELVQGFFCYFLDKKVYEKASQERGRFRCFILGVLKHFIVHEYNRQNRLKRGGGQDQVSLDDAPQISAPVAEECADLDSPDRAFDRKWALTTVQLAMEQLRKECAEANRLELFQILKTRFVSDGEDTASYAELAAASGKSESSLRVDAHRLRQRFQQLLHQTVQRTLLPSVSVEDEMEHLLNILRGK
jgi:RNA polymerase sigma-70 factor (ECF subfamily)